MKKVELLNLRCKDGCGAPLAIIADNVAECDYCDRVYRIIENEDIIDWKHGPWDPYFLDPDKRCGECNHYWARRCNYWDVKAYPDQLCDHFEESSDYFLKGDVESRAYPYNEPPAAVEAFKEKIEHEIASHPYPSATVYPIDHCGDCSHHKTHWWHGKDWCGKLKEPAYYLRSACKDFEEKHD